MANFGQKDEINVPIRENMLLRNLRLAVAVLQS
jgi:hypothetical protein